MMSTAVDTSALRANIHVFALIAPAILTLTLTARGPTLVLRI